MKILALHTSEAGPLGSQFFHFKDDWSGTIATHILLVARTVAGNPLCCGRWRCFGVLLGNGCNAEECCFLRGVQYLLFFAQRRASFSNIFQLTAFNFRDFVQFQIVRYKG